MSEKEYLNCIPNNEENYTSFTLRIVTGYKNCKNEKKKPKHFQARFLDSARFMNASFSSLVNNLKEEDLKNVKKKKYFSKDEIKMLTCKAVYPYDYVNSDERMKETQVPPKVAFYSKLSGEDINDEDYAHALKVWNVSGSR